MLYKFFQTGSIFSGGHVEQFANGGGILKAYRLVPQKDRGNGLIESVGEKQERYEGDYEGAIKKAKELLALDSDFVEVHVTKIGKNVLSSKKVAVVNSSGVIKLEDGGGVEGDWLEDKFEGGGRVYKLGDKWSNDFDYEGMLEFGSTATIELGEEKLEKLHRSFEDVNYHTAGRPLWAAVKLLRAGNEYEAKQKMVEFNIICKEEIIEMNTPDTLEHGGGILENITYKVRSASPNYNVVLVHQNKNFYGKEIDGYTVLELFKGKRNINYGVNFWTTNDIKKAISDGRWEKSELPIKFKSAFSKAEDELNLKSRFENGGGVDSRIAKMIESWNEEGRAFSSLNQDDSEFIEKTGVPYMKIGITSQTGDDLVYYDTTLYNSDDSALKQKVDAIINVAQKLKSGEMFSKYRMELAGAYASRKDAYSHASNLRREGVPALFVDNHPNYYVFVRRKQLASGGSLAQKNKVARVMHEFKFGKLKSSSGDLVTDRSQALAIALSSAGLSKYSNGGYVTSIESFRLPATDVTPIGQGGIPNYNTPLDVNVLNEEMIYAKGGGVESKRKMYLHDVILYKGELHYISLKNGVLGLENLKQGAWGSDYPFTPIGKIKIDDVTDMMGGKVSIEEMRKGGSISEDLLMAKSDVLKLEEYAKKISDSISPSQEVDAWVIGKISKVEQTTANVKHTLEAEYPKMFAVGGKIDNADGNTVRMMCLHIGKYAKSLLKALESGVVLDSWMKHELSIAGSMIDSVFHYLDYFNSGNHLENGGGVENYAGGGVVIYKELDLNRRDGKKKTTQVTTVDSYKEALERIDELKKKNKNPHVRYFTGDIYRNGGSLKANDLAIGTKIKHKGTGVTVKVYNVNPKTGMMQCERDGVKFPQWRSAKDYELVKK